MAINSVATVIEYDCDGATTRFPITFTYLADTNIIVKHYDDSTQTLSDLANPAGYEVVSDEVETVATYPIDDKIFITLSMDFMQETDLEPNGKIAADVLDAIHDKLTLMCQQLRVETDSVIGLEVPEPDADMSLPGATIRASKYLAFDALGNATVVSSVDVGVLTISSYGETVVAAANPSALRTLAEVYSETETDAAIDVDVSVLEADLSGVGRTTETIKDNADDIATNADDIATNALAIATSEVLNNKARRLLLSNWDEETSANSAISWYGIGYSPDLEMFCAVGTTGNIMTSTNGIVWTIRTAPRSYTYQDVCWSPSLSLFCAVAASSNTDTIATSPDGITWTVRTSPNTAWWNSVCWSPELSLFCAVGGLSVTNLIITSPDGITWTSRVPDVASQVWRSVAWSPELTLFCTVSQGGKVMTSPNGIAWTERTGIAEEWSGIAWSPTLGLFCAVQKDSVMTYSSMTSPDGITWTGIEFQSSLELQWNEIIWAEGIEAFVAVSENGTTTKMIGVSYDGINWSGRHAPNSDSDWNDLSWSNELGMICAISSTGAGERLMTTPLLF